MQYETIILELLSRIKELEDEVSDMRRTLNATNALNCENEAHENPDCSTRNSSTVAYTKMNDEMIDICYKCGKKVRDGESAQELADEIADETGMNRNSAIMYLYAVSGMLDGSIYKRAISAKAIQRYFDLIFDEYGSAGLKKAIKATRLHIEYRTECGHTVDSIETICERNESKL